MSLFSHEYFQSADSVCFIKGIIFYLIVKHNFIILNIKIGISVCFIYIIGSILALWLGKKFKTTYVNF